MPSHVRAKTASRKAADSPRPPDRWLTPAVLLCFVTSGAASLILEATLTRMLRLVLGNTSLAVTTVLCAFMGGLALGGYLGGRLGERANRPLRTYAILEGSIGLACLLLPAAVHALQPVYHWLYLYAENSFLLLSLVRFTFCGLLLLIPATFMGATLPVLSRWYAARTDRMGRAIAWLYTANSLGATAGVLLCAFVLLPGLGLGATIRLACTLGFGVCLVGLLLDRKTGPIGPAVPDKRSFRPGAPGNPPGATGNPPGATGSLPASAAVLETVLKSGQTDPGSPLRRTRTELALLLAYGLSGAAALIYEVAWTRVLSLLVGSSVYAFSLMLAAFILGLAIGSAIAGRFVDRTRDPVSAFAIIELGIALTALAAVPLFGQLPVVMVRIIQQYSHSFSTLLSVEFTLIVLVMIVPTTLMGAAFVFVSRACMSLSSRVERTIGGIYAANTVGGVIGAFTATFVWIPWIGTQHTILLASAANVAIGAFFLLPAFRTVSWRSSVLGLAGVASLVVAGVFLPPWDPAVMSSGAYLYATQYAPSQATTAGQIRANMRSSRVLFHREDMGGTVTVREDATGDRALVVGGKADASRAGDMPTQMLVGHAPLLLHPQPRTALVIGLASGMTLGAAAAHPLDRIDCVEISPAVVNASEYFKDDNGHALADPRVHLILGDGRNHVALTDRTYDVIISEPSNPWLAGIADLFTIEYFQACRSRLNPGGLACVWLQAYSLEADVFRSVVRTFHEVFPHMVIIEAALGADYLLIGSPEPIRVPYAQLARRMAQPALAASLAKVDLHEPLDLLQRISLGGDQVPDFADDAPLHTDDSVMLEFAAPRSLYTPSQATAILADMYRLRQPDPRMLVVEPGQDAQKARLQTDLARRLQARAMASVAAMLWSKQSFDQALDMARKALDLEPAACDPLLAKGRELLRQATVLRMVGNLDEAVKLTTRAAALAPHLLATHLQLADLLAQSDRWTDAVQALRAALARQPDNQAALNNLAWILATAPDDKARKGSEALDLARRLCPGADSRNPLFLRTLAAALAETGHFDDALATATVAASLAANDPSLAAELRDQSALYRQAMPFRQPSHKNEIPASQPHS